MIHFFISSAKPVEQNNFSNENFLNELLMTFSTLVHTQMEKQK